MIDNPFNLQDPTLYLGDAMDKIVEHEDVSFSEPRNWIKFRDCMDLVTGCIDDIVDFVNSENIAKLVAGSVQRIEITSMSSRTGQDKTNPHSTATLTANYKSLAGSQ